MKVFEEIEGLVAGKISVLKTVISMIKLETKLAGLSVFPLLLGLCLLFVITLTLWASLMFLFGHFAFQMFSDTSLAITAVLLLNLVLLLGLVKYLMFNLKQMSFQKTRAYISNRENKHDDEEGIDCSNSNDGKNITLSANESIGA